MIQDFTKEELESEKSLRDTELTLGGGMLLVLGGGLVVLCALCFGIGYSIGHRTSADQSVSNVLTAPNVKSAAIPVEGGSKPTAAGQAPARAQAQPVDETSTVASDESKQPAQVVPAAVGNHADSSQSQVKTAANSQDRPEPGRTMSASPSSFQVMPPMTKVPGWMVQIAAVSRSDDAEVLVNALRRHGYSVTARRDNGDTLIHVQTGPFVNRNDANAMRQKLLNDGYNAIVQ